MWRVRGCSSTSPEGEQNPRQTVPARAALARGVGTQPALPRAYRAGGIARGRLRRGDVPSMYTMWRRRRHTSLLSVPAWSVHVCVCVCRGGPLPPLVRYSAAWSGARANQRASRHGPRAQVLSLDWYSRKMCVRACGAVREKWAEAADPVRARGISVYFGWRCVKEKVLLTVAWWTRFTHVYAQYMYVSSMSHAFYMNSTASSTEQRAGAGFGCSTSTLSPPWRITL